MHKGKGNRKGWWPVKIKTTGTADETNAGQMWEEGVNGITGWGWERGNVKRTQQKPRKQ